MAIAKAAFLKSQAYTSGRAAPMLDLAVGGQHGYHPNFGQLTNNTGHIAQPLVNFMLIPPRGFNFLPQKEKWTAGLKSLIEVQRKQLTGLRTGLTTEAGDRALGQAGHMMREAVKTTEAMSTPTRVWDVNYNKGIPLFWERYKRLLMSEPITGQPGVMNLGGNLPTDRLIDFYGFTSIAIEKDITGQYAIDAWLLVNEWPLTSGEMEFQFDPTASAPVPEISIEFACTPIRNDGVLQVAQELLSRINYANAGASQRASVVTGVDSAIQAASRGYVEDIVAAVSGA
jgi:hypothetical protein